MLVLSRAVGEKVIITKLDEEIAVIEVLKVKRGQEVSLGITGPLNVRIDREEVHIRRKEGKG